jgi:hypothetical protein
MTGVSGEGSSMPKSLLTTALTLSLLACAGAAAAQQASPVSGQVGLEYMRSNMETAGTNLDVDFITLEGAIAYGSGHFGGSLDGAITQDQLTPGREEMAYTGTLHLNLRGAIGQVDGLVGVFGGADNSDNLQVHGGGLEAQANVSDWMILNAQLGFGRTNDLVGATSKLWATRFDARYYPMEDLKLQASYGYQEAKDIFGKHHSWIAGVEAEYILPNTPFSLVAGYNRYEISQLDTISNVWRIGGRYTFGVPTLHQRDASGASLGTVSRLFSLDLLRGQ